MNNVANERSNTEEEIYKSERSYLIELQEDSRSIKELIILELNHFYNILNKQVRFRFIEDVRTYIKDLRKYEIHNYKLPKNEEQHEEFETIEYKIRKNHKK
ncbi:hypothetical protein [Haloplasma contractile]|uniref:Uncharacterized protein n=1 Tax=Haloplasma contractile SSD-17B TaxID=1033810 RepID=U2EER0_9MOLU|nr:hypothetical protein [Haloplasma contractile]ERJ13186.1 hypothetical protein HLPCO_000805 [Haloplasma contractile SSD-17B]